MTQIFRKKEINKHAINFVVCVILMCLGAGNAWGQTININKVSDYSIIITCSDLKSDEFLVIFKNNKLTGKLNNKDNSSLSGRTVGGGDIKNANIEIIGVDYTEDEKFYFIGNGMKNKVCTSIPLSFNNGIPDEIHFYKIDGNNYFSKISPEIKKIGFEQKQQQEQPVPPKENTAEDLKNAKKALEQAQETGNHLEVVPAYNKVEEIKKQNNPQKPTITTKKETKPIYDYDKDIEPLQKQADKVSEYLKAENIDTIELKKYNKDVSGWIKEMDLLTAKINRDTELQKQKDKKDVYTKNLKKLGEQLRAIDDAIFDILIAFETEGLGKRLDTIYSNEFNNITKYQFIKVSGYIDSNRYEPDWYNWKDKWKYIKMLDDLERNSSAYIDKIEKSIKIICDTIKGIEKNDKNKVEIYLNRKLEKSKRRFKNIENSRNILETDFKIPYVKLSFLGLLFLLGSSAIIWLILRNARNKKIEKKEEEEKKKQEEKLGKSTFRKIDSSAALTNHENNSATNADSTSAIIIKPKFRQLQKYEHGLGNVKENVNKIYKEINMFDFVDNTSIHKVYISRDVIKELYKFFNEFLKSDGRVPETGCYLVGRWDYAPNSDQQAYDISLEYIIKPGRDAKYSEYECDFGAEIGTSLIMESRRYSEQANIEYVHTSWMHSHPGLQLFLSSQDLIVQSTLTNNSPYKRMLAIVIDTIDDFKMAFFTPKADNDNVMNSAENIKKTITLDELHHWAKTEYIEPQKEKPKTAVKIKATAKEYFSIPLKQKTETFDEIKLTRASVIDMSTGNKGFLCGKNKDNKLFIDAFVEEGDDKKAQIGMFKEVSNFDSEKWEKCKQTLVEDTFWKTNKILAVYCLNDKNLYLFTEKQNLLSDATIIPLQNLISWTREKRN